MSEERYDPTNGQSDPMRPADSEPGAAPGGDRMPYQNYGRYGYNPYTQPHDPGDYRWNFDDYDSASRNKKPKRNRGLMVFGALLAFVLVGGMIGLSAYGVYNLMANPTGESSGAPAASEQTNIAAPELTIKERPVDSSNTNTSANGVLSTVEIARKVRPSVVGIAQYSAYDTFNPSGEGSGIIINSDGYIVTNAHVVVGSVGINVELDNGETYSAQLVGIDSKTDLAVIKIEAKNLVAAEFGDSEALEVGERVVAIGNPGGSTLAGSVTQGIVSAVNRMIKDGGYSSSFIQTDAAINPGNSGGALVNEYGQVIGINSSKIAAVDYEGIGFAIPIHEAKPVIDALLQYGYVKGRTKIGISGQEINNALSQINGIPMGIYIWSIDPTSDLAGKSVTKGDIITKIDGVAIETFDDISTILKGKSPGDSIVLSIYRSGRGGSTGGQTFEISIKLMEDVDTTTKR